MVHLNKKYNKLDVKKLFVFIKRKKNYFMHFKEIHDNLFFTVQYLCGSVFL